MTEYGEQGAVPVEDAAVTVPPTADEVLERQEIEHPDQARTTLRSGSTDEHAAAQDAGGQVVDRELDGAPDIEGPNSA